jgi:hypothetical protein
MITTETQEPVVPDTSSESEATPEVQEAPPSWRDDVPEDYREEKTLSKYQTVADLAKGHVHLSRMMGNSIKIPGEDATDEERNDFFTKLGRPETADAYDYQRPDLPEGMAYDETSEKAFKELAHKQGLSQTQLGAILDFYNKFALDSQIDQKLVMDEAYFKGEAALQKEWGMKGYDRNVAIAQRAMKEFGGPELEKLLTEDPRGSHPALIKAFYKMGLKSQEARPLDSEHDSSFLDIASAQKEIENFNKPSHKFYKAYWNKDDPKHAEAVAYRDRLFDMAYPDE